MKDTVSTVLISTDNCFILQQRDSNPGIKYPGMVMNFGGSIESGEEPIDAIVREMQEELGLSFDKQDFTFLKKISHKNHLDDGEHSAYLFMAKNINRDVLVLREGEGIVYVPISELASSSFLSDRTKEELELGISI